MTGPGGPTFVLATSCARPDRAFASLAALAAALEVARAAAVGLAGADLSVRPGVVARALPPGGVCLAVRALNGAARPVWLAYVFLDHSAALTARRDWAIDLRAALATARTNAVRRDARA